MLLLRPNCSSEDEEATYNMQKGRNLQMNALYCSATFGT